MNRKKVLILALLSSLFLFTACSSKGEEKGDNKDKMGEAYTANKEYIDSGYEQFAPPEKGEEIVVIETEYGNIKARLFPDLAPKATENFSTHGNDGYYDDGAFHRVIDGFMIQGGDPEKTGMGGESIWGEPFETEVTADLHHIRGALAMAKGQAPVSQGSQFYIVQNNGLSTEEKEEMNQILEMQEEEIGEASEDSKPFKWKDIFPAPFVESYIENGGAPFLDGTYTVFGQVFEGMDIVDKIAKTEVEDSGTGEESSPVTEVKILSVHTEIYE